MCDGGGRTDNLRLFSGPLLLISLQNLRWYSESKLGWLLPLDFSRIDEAELKFVGWVIGSRQERSRTVSLTLDDAIKAVAYYELEPRAEIQCRHRGRCCTACCKCENH
jgi:hypothetical protein